MLGFLIGVVVLGIIAVGIGTIIGMLGITFGGRKR